MKYFKNTSWLFIEKILRMVVGLFVGVWVARYLGPEKFGLFSYAQSFVFLFVAISTLGLDGIVIRELVRDESQRDVLLGTAFWLKLIGAFVVLLVLAIAINFTSNDRYTNILVFIVASATIFQSFNVIDFYFQSKVLSRYVVFANIISLFISSILKIILILNEAPLIAFAYVILFDSLVLASGLLYFYSKTNLSIIKWKYNKKTAFEILRQSWPLMLVGMASMLNMRMDQVFLGNLLNTVVVGNYAAAIRVSELWLLLPLIIGSSIYPAIISAKDRDELLYKKRIFTTIKYMSIFAIPFALFISLFSSEIIKILYGIEYSEAGTYLAISIWIGVPYIIFFILNQVFIIEKITKFNFFIAIITVILNIGLNSLLIPKYGGIGAATATLIVAYTGFLMTIYVLFKKTNIFHSNNTI